MLYQAFGGEGKGKCTKKNRQRTKKQQQLVVLRGRGFRPFLFFSIHVFTEITHSCSPHIPIWVSIFQGSESVSDAYIYALYSIPTMTQHEK